MTNFQRTYSIGEVEVEGSADLPHDRVPRAPRPLHAVRLHPRDQRLRHVARRLRRRPQRPPRGRRPLLRRRHGQHRARVEPDRLASGRPPARAREHPRPSPSCSPTSSRATSPKFERPGVVDKTRGRAIVARYRKPGAVDAAFAALAAPVGRAPLHLPGGLPRRAREADGEHLEPVPVPRHLQPLAIGELLRNGHRARHGLPRLEPGRPRLRPPPARAGPAAHPRPRRHPARGRHLLPPVPAPDQAGERRHRR